MLIDRCPSTVGYSVTSQASLYSDVLLTRVGLEEIVVVVDKRGSDVIDNKWGIRPNEHGNGSTSTSWTSVALRVDGHI